MKKTIEMLTTELLPSLYDPIRGAFPSYYDIVEEMPNTELETLTIKQEDY